MGVTTDQLKFIVQRYDSYRPIPMTQFILHTFSNRVIHIGFFP